MTIEEMWTNTEVFVIDIDGTFRQGMTVVEEGQEFLSFMREQGKRFLFFTNNSSKAPNTYVKEFVESGCEVTENDVATTADVAAYYLRKNFPNQGIYVVGTKEFCEYLMRQGVSVVDNSQEECAAVLVSFDTSFNYDKMNMASALVREGKDFLATHLDVNCPVEGGYIPDCGAICASIERSSGRIPKSLGKPNEEAFSLISHVTGCKPEAITFIGDRLETDIAVGVKNGANTVLVLGGASSEEDIEKLQIQPDFVFDNLADFYHHVLEL